MKKRPALIEETPTSLINLDPAAAARSIAAAVSEKNDEKDWLDEKVMIQFYNIEEPGNEGFFCYGPVTGPTRMTLQHGEIRELTRAEVRFIESRQTPIYDYKQDARGKRVSTLVGWKPRYQCRSVNIKPVRNPIQAKQGVMN